MKFRAAFVAIVAAGVALAVVTLRRGPALRVPPGQVLLWSEGDIDAGATWVDQSWRDVEFVGVQDTDDPAKGLAAIRRGSRFIFLDDVQAFRGLAAIDGGVLVVGDVISRTGGPTIEVFASRDEGITFERSSIRKPVEGDIRRLDFDGRTLTITLRSAFRSHVGSEWLWPLQEKQVAFGAECAVYSNDLGASWRLR